MNRMKQIAVVALVAGIFAAGQALAVEWDFTSGEGFTNGTLAGQVGWTGNNSYTVDATGAEAAEMTNQTNVQWDVAFPSNNFDAVANNTFTISNVVSWTQVITNGGNSLFSLLLNDVADGGTPIRFSLEKRAPDKDMTKYVLTLKNDTGGSFGWQQFAESRLGLNQLVDADSDEIGFGFTVTKGATTNDWTYSFMARNLTTDAEVGSASGSFDVSTNIQDAATLYAGLSSGVAVEKNGASNRLVKAFTMDASYVEPPAPPKNFPAIVHWGEVGGDNDIVPSDQAFQVKVTTYAAGTEANPVPGDSYYSNRTDRSSVFNHASSNSGNLKSVKTGSDGDNIGSGKNADFYRAMVMWEDFLTTDSVLETLDIETKLGATAPTGTVQQAGDFRWVIEKGTGKWYASEPTTISRPDGYVAIHVEEPADLTWYDFTPMSAGSVTIGSEATIDMKDITSVGYYTDYINQISDKDGGGTSFVYKNLNTHTRYFKATATPGPITSTLLQWGAAGGETDIVPTTDPATIAEFQLETDTYVEGTEVSPVLGVDYYSNNANRSPIFNGALEFGSSAGGSVRDGKSAADYIQTTDNVTNNSSMVVWENFLSLPESINGISGEFDSHLSSNSASLYIVVKENDSWYATDVISLDPDAGYESVSIDPLTANWNDFTPMSNGVASVGSAVGILALTNVTAVGYYYEGQDDEARWHGIRTRSFLVTGTADLGLSDYEKWALENGVSGGATDDDDDDGLNNYGEYVFDGLPLDPNDIGTQPEFDGVTADYTFYLIGDNTVVAHVVTTDDLVYGTWSTNRTEAVSVNDGVLGTYVEPIGTAGAKRFIKLLVE